MIKIENGVQVLGYGSVLTFEQDDEDHEAGTWWLRVRSTITGDVETTVEIPAAELEPLAQWMLGCAARESRPSLQPVKAVPTEYCGRGLCARLEGHEGKCAT